MGRLLQGAKRFLDDIIYKKHTLFKFFGYFIFFKHEALFFPNSRLEVRQ